MTRSERYGLVKGDKVNTPVSDVETSGSPAEIKGELLENRAR